MLCRFWNQDVGTWSSDGECVLTSSGAGSMIRFWTGNKCFTSPLSAFYVSVGAAWLTQRYVSGGHTYIFYMVVTSTGWEYYKSTDGTPTLLGTGDCVDGLSGLVKIQSCGNLFYMNDQLAADGTTTTPKSTSIVGFYDIAGGGQFKIDPDNCAGCLGVVCSPPQLLEGATSLSRLILVADRQAMTWQVVVIC